MILLSLMGRSYRNREKHSKLDEKFFIMICTNNLYSSSTLQLIKISTQLATHCTPAHQISRLLDSFIMPSGGLLYSLIHLDLMIPTNQIWKS